MGNNKAGLKENIGIWAVVLISFMTTYFAITELFM
jgi:hypothetical protein